MPRSGKGILSSGSIFYYYHLVTLKLVERISQYTVGIVKVYISVLRGEIHPLRLFVKLYRYFCIINGNDILDNLNSVSALDGRSIKQMIYKASLGSLIHQRHNTLCRQACGQSLVFSEENIYYMLDYLLCDERAFCCILAEKSE